MHISIWIFTFSLFHQTTEKTDYWSCTVSFWTAMCLSAGILVGITGHRLRFCFSSWKCVIWCRSWFLLTSNPHCRLGGSQDPCVSCYSSYEMKLLGGKFNSKYKVKYRQYLMWQMNGIWDQLIVYAATHHYFSFLYLQIVRFFFSCYQINNLVKSLSALFLFCLVSWS